LSSGRRGNRTLKARSESTGWESNSAQPGYQPDLGNQPAAMVDPPRKKPDVAVTPGFVCFLRSTAKCHKRKGSGFAG